MNEDYADFEVIRDQQLTQASRIVAVIGFFAVVDTIPGAIAAASSHILCMHTALFLVALVSALRRHCLANSVRAGIAIVTPFLIGVIGLLSSGLAPFSIMALFCFCVLSSILLGAGAGLRAAIISASTVAFAGACSAVGITSFHGAFDRNSASAWIMSVFSVLVLAWTIVFALGNLKRQVNELSEVVERQNADLLQKNLIIENEIDERALNEEKAMLLGNVQRPATIDAPEQRIQI